MKLTLQPGLRHAGTLEVLPSMTVSNVSAELKAFADMPPVFATAMMVAFIEATCIECIADHLEEGEHSVGSHINVSHTAATPPGMSVLAEVTLTSVERRMLTFKVEAFDDVGLIGQGSHQRAVIDIDRFNAKIADKAKGSSR
ncbi:thioesterase [Tabrizicola piscis]|uniref:Thioesterase n=1 Tax=Tabrizicola piscis TaxID=2494374 RepID=A0A3S8U759_9RHOB|nr:thioesterase family protein [Tabrizicola piscis]AZL59532.1 thioesterase [Tabrizicola piscis]